MCNDNVFINLDFKREKATAIVELFENLLEDKKIDIPCDDIAEQSVRYEEGNCARLYGIEYYKLVDDVMNVIYGNCKQGTTKSTNGYKSILEKAGRYDSSVAILKKVITCLQDSSVPVDPFVDDNNITQWRVEGKKCKEQAAQVLQIITDEVIINKDDLVGKLDEIYYLIKSNADMKLHNYAIYQSHRKTPYEDMETIRNYLVLADLILNLDTKNEVNPDESWSISEGWKTIRRR